MLPSSLFNIIAVFTAGVTAQTRTQTSSTSSTSSSAVTTYSIAVGAEGFRFSPNEIKNVSVGSVIEFNIYPGGHAVARSDFKRPCIPYALTGPNRVGFYSGNISPQVVSDNLPKYSVTVNDTEPIFFYCTAPLSCIKEHMIGVVNPNANETFDIQTEFVNNATLQLTPGDNFPQEGATSTGATPDQTGSASAGNSGNHSSSGLGPGPIAGIAIGGAAVLVLAAALIYLCGRRGGNSRAYPRSTPAMSSPPAMEYYGRNPKSPGQATFSTSPRSLPPDQFPYHSNSGSPPQQPYMQHTPPPPLSPHHSGYNTYQSTSPPRVHSPQMSEMHGHPGHHHLPVPGAAPVELPTSQDPGHSPLPQYQRQFSWSQGTEGQYRPGKP